MQVLSPVDTNITLELKKNCFRCLIPQCEDSQTSIFAPPWLALAIPASGVSFDSCKRFASKGEGNGTCVLEEFDHGTVVPCEQHLYENTHSVVYDVS